MKNNILKFTTIVCFLVGNIFGSHYAMAALSAVASLSPSTTTINHPVNVSLAISNTSGSILTLNNVKLTATSTLAPVSSRVPVAFSVFNQASGMTIAANSTTTIPVGQAVFFSPSTGITGSSGRTFSVGGLFYTSDGSITAVETAGIATINPIPLPAAQRQ